MIFEFIIETEQCLSGWLVVNLQLLEDISLKFVVFRWKSMNLLENIFGLILEIGELLLEFILRWYRYKLFKRCLKHPDLKSYLKPMICPIIWFFFCSNDAWMAVIADTEDTHHNHLRLSSSVFPLDYFFSSQIYQNKTTKR